ncbi:acyl carrier protein [Sphingobacterium suaedae]|uniref:Acyl carrier protein n=1 Tax=Sphingobacterium suaedae TaxID=1686402 RepID=A0ABW5KML5_9SPHI
MDDELKNIDPDDINDLLIQIEKSFGIEFGDSELFYISTFGELCDHIVGKITYDSSNDCTSQQAFYKLRDAIVSTGQIDPKSISTNSSLMDLLPKERRRVQIKKWEQRLGFELNILRPPYWLSTTLVIILLASFVGFSNSWQVGLAGLVFAIAGFWFANKIANELDIQTVGQLVRKMTRENYLKSRRNPTTFNKNEIEKVLIDCFSNDLGIDKSKLTRESRFV